MRMRVHLGQQVGDHVDLAGNLGPAQDGHIGPGWVSDDPAEIVELFRHEIAGGTLLEERVYPLGGGVRPVGGAEGVVDVDIAEGGQLAREGRVVFLLLRCESAGSRAAGHRPVDAAPRRTRPARRCSPRRKRTGSPAGAQAPRHRAAGTCRRTRWPSRPAEVGHEDELAAAADDVPDRRERGADPRIVGDLAALQRDVEIHPHQHPFALYVEIVDSELRHCTTSG